MLSKAAFQQEILEKKLNLLSKATVVSKISPEQKSDDVVDLLGKLNIKPYAGTKLDQLVDFDCVEVRFMKAPADTDDDIPKKDETILEKLFKEGLDFGSMEEGYTIETDTQPSFLKLLEHDENDMQTQTTVDKSSSARMGSGDGCTNELLLGTNPVDSMIRNAVIFNAVEEIYQITPTAGVEEEIEAQDIRNIEIQEFDEAPTGTGITINTPIQQQNEEYNYVPDMGVEQVIQDFEMQSLLSPSCPSPIQEVQVNSEPIADQDHSLDMILESCGVNDSLQLTTDRSSPTTTIADLTEQDVADNEQMDTFSQPILRGLISAPKKRTIGKGKNKEQATGKKWRDNTNPTVNVNCVNHKSVTIRSIDTASSMLLGINVSIMGLFFPFLGEPDYHKCSCSVT